MQSVADKWIHVCCNTHLSDFVLQYIHIFTDSVHQAHYKWCSQEHHGLLASLWKGQVVPVEVFRAPGSNSSRGGPPPCHRRRVATTTWLAETSWLRVIDEDVRPQNFGVHTAWRKATDRGTWHQVVSIRQRSARSSPPRSPRRSTYFRIVYYRPTC